jgi:hypothetical protein
MRGPQVEEVVAEVEEEKTPMRYMPALPAPTDDNASSEGGKDENSQ